MLPPGAETSGFSVRSAASLYELKSDWEPPVGFGNRLGSVANSIIVEPPPATISAASAAPSVCSRLTAGIVISVSPSTVMLMTPEVLL